MRKPKRPPNAEPFDVTLPDGFEPADGGAALEEAAKQAGWAVERDGAVIAVRDVWTDNEDHAAWLVASKVDLSPEKVTVWAATPTSVVTQSFVCSDRVRGCRALLLPRSS